MLLLKQISFFIVFLILSVSGINKTFAFAESSRDNQPTIIIHDTIAAPGELLLQLDALNFVGDNGQVAAITLRIEVDTNLIEFISIQNTTIAGTWIGNYNTIEDEITITFTAPYPTGYDINGKLLDLKLHYFGGFPADLHFKGNCEISNSFLQEIEDVVYEDGTITQITAVGNVSMDSVVGVFQQEFAMPLFAQGDGYDQVDQMHLRIGYDSLLLDYSGFDESALSGVEILDSIAILTINWEDDQNPLDLTALDTLLYLNFNFIGDTNATTEILHGSTVYNNSTIVATDFFDGFVRGKFIVVAENNPENAGTATGDGYFFPNETVTLTAIPENGFHFLNWTKDNEVVSTDSIYTFIKQYSNDTIIANYIGNLHTVSLTASPEEGGEVIGAGDYNYDDEVTVNAIPTEGYYFEYWLDGTDTVSLNPVYTFVMPDNDLSLTAVFTIYTFIITAEPNNIDYGTTEGGGEFNYGDTATLIATPFESYKFVVWTENNEPVSYDSIYEFEVFSDRDLIANFQIDAECLSPINLFVDELNETTAALHWLPAGEEEEWDLIWGITGFDTIDEGQLVEGLTETNYLLENLDPGSGYDFYVKAVCTDDLSSAWSSPFTFTTWYVGINALNNEDKIKIFPNPATSELKLVFNGNYSGNVSYRVINTLGVLQIENSFTKSDNLSINLNGLSSGIYILQILVDNTMITKVFLKN